MERAIGGNILWVCVEWLKSDLIEENEYISFNSLPFPIFVFHLLCHRMFRNAVRFNARITDWNVSKGTNFGRMFMRCQRFNRPLNWNVRNAVSMFGMVRRAIYVYFFGGNQRKLSRLSVSLLVTSLQRIIYQNTHLLSFACSLKKHHPLKIQRIVYPNGTFLMSNICPECLPILAFVAILVNGTFPKSVFLTLCTFSSGCAFSPLQSTHNLSFFFFGKQLSQSIKIMFPLFLVLYIILLLILQVRIGYRI